MFKLIVNPGTDQAWEIPLKDGFTTIGSDPSTGCAIEHESISATHCEVVVSGSDVQVLDLGSAQGTLVNGVKIEQAVLKIGQKFQVGAAELQLVTDESVPAPGGSGPPLPPSIPVSGRARSAAAALPHGARCKHHPKSAAAWICDRCHAGYCDLCVSLRQAGENAGRFCRKCGFECVPAPAPAVEPEPVEPGILKLLPGAFQYPLKGNGLILVVAGTVFFFFLSMVQSLAGFLGPYGFVAAAMLGVLTVGYLFTYAKSVITSSAAGLTEPPDWPDFSDWTEDVVMPFGQMLALAVLTFGPAAILRWWQPGGEHWGRVATLVAAGLGAFLAPMGLLALAMFDSVAALNPVALVWSILRIPLPYLIAAAAFEAVAYGWFHASDWIRLLLPIPIVPGVVAGFLNLYLVLVGTRILGLLYRANKEELGWF